jgi:hypothetical protein
MPFLFPKPPRPIRCLRPGLLLLLLPQSQETDTRDLDDLETDTGNITLGLALATETSQEDLVVLVHEVQATVIGDEGSDLLSVLDELNTDTFSDSGVGLLGLDTDLLEDDALGVRRTSEWRRLISGTKGTLLVGEIGPFLVLSVCSQLTGGVKTTGFASSHFCGSVCVSTTGW